MRRIISCFIILSIGLLSAYSQNYDGYLSDALDEYDVYKKDALTEYEKYRAEVNAEFSQYMREAWEKTNYEQPIQPIRIVPSVPPAVFPDFDDLDFPGDNEITFADDLIFDWDDEKPLLIPLIEPVRNPESKIIRTYLYGTACELHLGAQEKIRMKGSSEKDAADMWEELSSSDYDELLYDCLAIRSEKNLCDWAYYRLTQSVSQTIFGDSNEAVVMTAFLMNQSGYRTRLSRGDDERMHLLLAFDDDIFNTIYYTIHGVHYYLTDKSDPENLYIFKHEFPQERALSLSITKEILLDEDFTSVIHLKSRRYPQLDAELVFNKNLLDLYSDYPHPYKRGNKYSSWAFYAGTELSMQIKEMLYPVLIRCIAGKTQEEAANMLINFVQTAFSYKTDDDYWGYERSFFPEETLFYPFSDCEDRAILFTRLIRDLLGLDAILLYYPGHIAAAVEFSENIPGDYLVFDNGRRFLICDPTYINANVGMTMPGMDNTSAIVIRLS